MKKLKLQELEDIVYGCTIMGTGGGGGLNDGLKALRETYYSGHDFFMLDFDDIKEDRYYVNPYYCGTVNPDSDKKEDLFSIDKKSEIELAIEGLESYMELDFHGLVSIEYGGGNTAFCMSAAAKQGKFIVDADAAGRAVPELQFSTYSINSIDIFPFAIATKYGDIAVFTKVKSDVRAEALARSLAVASGNLVGMADHPILGRDLKNVVIPKALTFAKEVGSTRRIALENNDQPVKAILEVTEGVLLCEGIVNGDLTHWTISDGFTTGEIGIDGTGSFKGKSYKIWYRNENMVIWEDGEVLLTCPDLICVLRNPDAYPITNPNLKSGDKVSVIGIEAHSFWKTEQGLKLLNPKFFGFTNIEIKQLIDLR